MIYSTMFCLLTSVFSQIAIVLPFTNIPFSLSICAVFLSGLFLKPKYAFLSQISYILIGIIGIPVFSNFSSSISAILSPNGGYILSYPLMSITISLLMHKTKINKIVMCIISTIFSLIICYTMGAIWYHLITGIEIKKVIYITILPFVIVDIIKIILTTTIFKILLNHKKISTYK